MASRVSKKQLKKMTLPSTGEGKAGGSRVQGLLGLHSKTLSLKQGFSFG